MNYDKARELRLADCRTAAVRQASDVQPDDDVIMPPVPDGYGFLGLTEDEHKRIEDEAGDLFCTLFVDTLRARIADMRERADGLEKLTLTFTYGRDTAHDPVQPVT